MKYVANKMVFIDFNDVLFFNLYIGKGQDMIILRYQLQHLNNYMRTIYQKTPQRYFKDMLQCLHQTMVDGNLEFYCNL